ncbi:MAG: EamA family transporter [Alphaproteobacteria bacterium]|nr:EamA family transporter [Alphaproteobacteria bacterium]
MVGSAVTFTLMTTLIKYLGADYGPMLQTFYRQLAGLAVMAPIIARDPLGAFYTNRPDIMIFRAGATTIGMILAFYSYQALPLADANALSFTRALWIVPLAFFVLGEKVGRHRISATLVGFAGVIIMLQPSGQGGENWYGAAASLGSAFLFAMTITAMKVATRDNAVSVLMVWAATLGFVLSIPLAIFEWRWPALSDFLLLCAMGVLGLATQYCYIKGMSLGDAVAMAPIDYTRLVFAILLGLALFQEVPNLLTMLGAAVVIAATLYITVREARLKRAPPPPARE